MKRIIIKNGSIYSDGKIAMKNIAFENGEITDTDFHGDTYENDTVYDATGKYVCPGFIDIHLHGGGGYDLMDSTEEAICGIVNAHLKNGTTTLFPTTITCSDETLFRLFKIYRKVSLKFPTFQGLHLEGPFLSYEKKGAHNEKYLRIPYEYNIDKMLYEGDGIIARCTAAPELDGARMLAEKMLEKGILMSAGHSDATAQQIIDAFSWGFTHVTHFYNMSPSIRKLGQDVYAGIIEAAYLTNGMTIELIGDGKHVPKEAALVALKFKGADKIALITDALRPAGTDSTESYLGEENPENKIVIEDGVAKVPDRSVYAGSIATCAVGAKTMHFKYGIALNDTIKMLTETPAKIMNLNRKGNLKKGFDADIVILDKSLNVVKVFSMGNIII